MNLNFGINLQIGHVRSLQSPDNLHELEESCLAKRFGAKVFSNQSMEPTR